MRYFFHIGYNGFHYRGWQRQPNVPNVQEVLENTLAKLFKTSINVMGCGRTDAQVHASQYFFHIHVEQSWDYDLVFRLNKNLPDDIAIFDIIPVGEQCHARFDATQRAYDYFIHTYKDPFLNSVSSLYQEKNLAVDKMQQAAALLTRYNDYRAFCKTPDSYDHTICNVTASELWVDPSGDRIRFHISANRFLGRMIRIIVGRLLAIGKGELSVDAFENYLITKNTPQIIDPAYPQGLFLSKVIYPYLDLPPRTEFSAIIQNKVNNTWRLV